MDRRELNKLTDGQYKVYKEISDFTVEGTVPQSGVCYLPKGKENKAVWYLIAHREKIMHIQWENRLDGRSVQSLIHHGILKLYPNNIKPILHTYKLVK